MKGPYTCLNKSKEPYVSNFCSNIEGGYSPVFKRIPCITLKLFLLRKKIDQ